MPLCNFFSFKISKTFEDPLIFSSVKERELFRLQGIGCNF